jgi:DNA-binding phage protein
MKCRVDSYFSSGYGSGMDIIAVIRARGKTVAGVCREAGISRQAFYALLAPESNPQMNTIVAVAKAIGIAPSQIKPELAE